MIVVNRARRLLGHDVEVTISSVLQTAAGRMAFAELPSGSQTVDESEPQPEPSTVGTG